MYVCVYFLCRHLTCRLLLSASARSLILIPANILSSLSEKANFDTTSKDKASACYTFCAPRLILIGINNFNVFKIHSDSVLIGYDEPRRSTMRTAFYQKKLCKKLKIVTKAYTKNSNRITQLTSQ